MNRKVLIANIILMAIAGLIFVVAAMAAEVRLSWDATGQVDGYRIYQRTFEGDYTVPAWEGKETTATITGLSDGTACYFVARAFVGAMESGNSNEVEFIPVRPTPTPEPTPAPTPIPEPKCFRISDASGFISAASPGSYTMEDAGRLWIVSISEPQPSPLYSGNTASKTFHKPGCRYYQCSTCTEIFSSKEDAVKAGYKPCGICKP